MVSNNPENKNANPQNSARPKLSELKKWIITTLLLAIVTGGMSYLGTCQASNRQFESSRYQTEFESKSDAYSDFMTGIHQMYTTAIQYAVQYPFDIKTNTASDPKEQTLLQLIWEWTGSFYRLVPFIDEKVDRDSLRGNMTDYAQWVIDLRYGNESTNEEKTNKYQEYEDYFREDLRNELFP
jgi:hypothetical protein